MFKDSAREQFPGKDADSNNGITDRYLDGIGVSASALKKVYGIDSPEPIMPALFQGDRKLGVLTKMGQEVIIAAEHLDALDLDEEEVYAFVAQMRTRDGVDSLELASKLQQLFGIGEDNKFKSSGMRFYDGVSVEGKNDVLFALKGYRVRDANDLDVVSGIIARMIERRIEAAGFIDCFTPGLLKIAHAPAKELDVERFRQLVLDTDLNEEAMWLASGIDVMTGMPNRFGMYRRLEALFDMLPEDTSRFVMTVFTDGDGFKQTNDTFGHSEGDKIIHSLAKRVQGFGAAFKRAFPFHTQELQVEIGRYGGDEFVVTLAGIQTPSNDTDALLMQNFATRYFKNESMPEYGVRALHTYLREPNTGANIKFDTTSTIGISTYTYADARLVGYEKMVGEADGLMNDEKARTLRRRAGEHIGQVIGGRYQFAGHQEEAVLGTA